MTSSEKYKVIVDFVHEHYSYDDSSCMSCLRNPFTGRQNWSPDKDKVNATIHILKSVGICYVYLNQKCRKQRKEKYQGGWSAEFVPDQDGIGGCISVEDFFEIIKEILEEVGK